MQSYDENVERGLLSPRSYITTDETTSPSFLKSCTIHRDIYRKLIDIQKLYQKYPSYQHAAWIIEEEYREFCAELFKKDSEWDYTKIYKELIDIMAACYRTIIDRDLLSHVKASAENTEES